MDWLLGLFLQEDEEVSLLTYRSISGNDMS